jgi:hypothetical protein
MSVEEGGTKKQHNEKSVSLPFSIWGVERCGCGLTFIQGDPIKLEGRGECLNFSQKKRDEEEFFRLFHNRLLEEAANGGKDDGDCRRQISTNVIFYRFTV